MDSGMTSKIKHIQYCENPRLEYGQKSLKCLKKRDVDDTKNGEGYISTIDRNSHFTNNNLKYHLSLLINSVAIMKWTINIYLYHNTGLNTIEHAVDKLHTEH